MKNEIQELLIDKILECSSAFFERLIVELIVAMGYGGSVKDAGKAIGKSGDEGIDGHDLLASKTMEIRFYNFASRNSKVCGQPSR
nr:restriction endonuclease [Psychrobacillus sp. OK028]